ncbi:MAG: hypothetical protein J7647_19685 [Cyanobacteria bacterium SBLK]|nr:hypothetical protein [Cyanobacteria bacterium SBLK]
MYQYSVKVKNRPSKPESKTYLWGGKGIKTALLSQLYLIVRVPELGESIKIVTQTGASEREEIGTLEVGEVMVIPLNNVTGIIAECEESKDSRVECVIDSVANNTQIKLGDSS